MASQFLGPWLLAAAMTAQFGAGPAISPPSKAPPTAPSPATADPALPALVALRQTSFAIPFRIETASDPTWQPVAAQLYVSTDRGKHWRLYAKAPVAQKHFPFRAGGDGEFWFAVRTLDRSGQARPATIPGPGLRILVDTKPPTVKLEAKPNPAGQVSVDWEINEAHAKPNGLKMFYRSSPVAPWQALAIEPHSAASTGENQKGAVAFAPPSGSGEIQIRAEASDIAGNVAVAAAQVKLDNLAISKTDPSKGPVALDASPAIGNNYTAPGGTSSAANPWGLPPGERPRMLNSKTFELEYDVDSVGPSGISRVELWGTSDGGRSWRRFADDDKQGPLKVSVDAEGIYGFRVVLTSGAGLGGKTPTAGDAPDLWIGVDLTKPAARIVSVQPGTETETGHLIVSWHVDDQMLAARPISLSFSEDPAGPWTPIASGLENTGRYAWPMDNRLPAQIYLRLEARDEAANVAAHQTSQAVTIDQSRPTARVRGIRPVGQSGILP